MSRASLARRTAKRPQFAIGDTVAYAVEMRDVDPDFDLTQAATVIKGTTTTGQVTVQWQNMSVEMMPAHWLRPIANSTQVPQWLYTLVEVATGTAFSRPTCYRKTMVETVARYNAEHGAGTFEMKRHDSVGLVFWPYELPNSPRPY